MPESATFRLHSLSAFVLMFVVTSATIQSYCSSPPENPPDEISQLLQQLISAPPDSCMGPQVKNLDPDQIERSILEESSNLVLQQLNQSGPELAAASEHATDALNKIKELGGNTNKTWPEENRFHFDLLNIAPAMVLKVGIGTHERYFVFGVPAKDDSGKPNKLWRQVGEDDLELEQQYPRTWMELRPLHRGPSGNPRFLAAMSYTGCAGSSGIVYDGREWSPTDSYYANQVISQEGSLGMDEEPNNAKPTPKDPFAAIGKLQTKGPIIALPFCWFSAIDTWDNPSMCALDTYDLSGNTVKFRSRAYNRPDLLPIARAIEYAEKHDFPAVRSYCASDNVARRLVEEISPLYFAEDLQVIRVTSVRERVSMGLRGDVFAIEKHQGRWLVVKFTPGNN